MTLHSDLVSKKKIKYFFLELCIIQNHGTVYWNIVDRFTTQYNTVFILCLNINKMLDYIMYKQHVYCSICISVCIQWILIVK